MKKISYIQLQKKYAGKLVALSGKEDRVISVGKSFNEIFLKIKNMGLNPKDCVFVGPVGKMGAINVYAVSLRKKTD